MISHVSYHEIQCSDAIACMTTIREMIDLGWQISQIRGGRNGPYLLIFRKDESCL